MRFANENQRKAVMAKLRGRSAINLDNVKIICQSKRGSKVLSKHDKIYREDGRCKVRLHRTDVVDIDPINAEARLNTGGWYTTTTKDRINRIIEDAGYQIFQKDYTWYIKDPQGNVRVFEDNMVIKSDVFKDVKAEQNPSRTNPIQLLNDITAYESGNLSEGDTVKLFSKLVKSGQAWTLQGRYGRQAKALIDARILDNKGNIL